MTKKQAKVVIRPMNDDEFGIVYSSIMRGMSRSRDRGPIISSEFGNAYHATITAILNRPGVLKLVAVNPEDDKQVYGYSLVENGKSPIIHYVYTKGPFRSFGIAHQLLKASDVHPNQDVYYTFRPSSLESITALKARYRPNYVNGRTEKNGNKNPVDVTSAPS